MAALDRAVDDGVWVVCETDVGDSIFFTVHLLLFFGGVCVVDSDCVVIAGCDEEVVGSMEGEGIDEPVFIVVWLHTDGKTMFNDDGSEMMQKSDVLAE